MAEISLYLTSGTLDYASNIGQRTRMIVYNSASADIQDSLRRATALSPVTLILAGALTLNVGDTSGIWSTHNGAHLEDFDAVYELLARYPDKRFRFLCEAIT